MRPVPVAASEPALELIHRFADESRRTPALAKELQVRERRIRRAGRQLDPERIPLLTEEELRELFFDSSAFQFWRDREGEFQRRLARVGLEGLKATLAFLIERAGEGLTPHDLHEIRANTGVGLLLATELACYRHPERCWVYSTRITLPALRRLGFDLRSAALPGHRSDPYLYAAAAQPMEIIRQWLQQAGLQDPNFSLADLFLNWVYEREKPGLRPQPKPRIRALPPRLREEDSPYSCRPLDVGATLEETLASSGLFFSRWQLAAFFTALQVKGFVVLSGISGTGKTRLAQQVARLLDTAEGASGSNYLFLPVRPDWRDSRSLLGYYNPLTQEYQWTGLLRFLVRVATAYRARDGRPYFVLLDEMNLARVEYYFADLLSVLESGRDAEGWTREPLRFPVPTGIHGERPPPELRLPPNLFLVGTVNVDETTHAFSPKVLDRAFVLELTGVDFQQYQSRSSGEEPTGPMRRELLRQFTNGGRFPRPGEAAEPDPMDEEIVDWLQRLTDLLRPHDLHFGYRVFDEIAAYLSHARRTGVFGAGGDFPALDAAVRMKVLPRLHGSRGKLERPVRSLLAWCLDPGDPDHATVDRALKPVESTGLRDVSFVISREFDRLEYRLPVTASRALRLLQSLYAEGFASFG